MRMFIVPGGDLPPPSSKNVIFLLDENTVNYLNEKMDSWNK